MAAGIVMPQATAEQVNAEARQQAEIRNMYVALFFGIVPVVTARRLVEPSESWKGGNCCLSEAIADEAEEIAKAAMKKLGIVIH